MISTLPTSSQVNQSQWRIWVTLALYTGITVYNLLYVWQHDLNLSFSYILSERSRIAFTRDRVCECAVCACNCISTVQLENPRKLWNSRIPKHLYFVLS